MNSYVVLLRGINVGGKNKLPMAELRTVPRGTRLSRTSRRYIASGNVLLDSDMRPAQIKPRHRGALPRRFRLDSELIAVAVLTADQLRSRGEEEAEGLR